MDTDTLDKEAQKILELSTKLTVAKPAEFQQMLHDLKQQCLVTGPRLAREYLVLKTKVPSKG